MKKLLTFVLFFCFVSPVFATHIKGGEISIAPVAGKSLTYEFTVTLYSEISRANVDQKDVVLCLGNGESITVSRVNGEGENIGNNVSKNIYKAIYTYTSNQTYTVSISISNRTPNIRNFTAALSEAVPFYIETQFTTTVNNKTPVLNNMIGVVQAKANQKFTYNTQAVDSEGDSLAYRLIVARGGNQGNCNSSPINIDGFKQPNEVSKIGTFKMDAKLGDLVWTAPTEIGNFVYAFVVEEWRKGVKISQTVRDMVIQVVDGDGTVTPIPPYEPVVTVLIPSNVLANENEINNETLTVFPNPTTNTLMAKISTDRPSKAIFQLWDVTGKLVQTYLQDDMTTTHEQEFDLKNIVSGTFILQVEAGNKVYAKKIIKQ